MELLADKALGLALVGSVQERLGREPEPEGLALRVQNRLDTLAVQLADGLGVEIVLDTPGQRAGEDDGLGAAREVLQLLAEHLELVGLDLGAPLVDLRVGAGGRVDYGRRRPCRWQDVARRMWSPPHGRA